MTQVHIAHDAQIGNQTILSHAATIGGHVVIGDWAVMSGGCACINSAGLASIPSSAATV